MTARELRLIIENNSHMANRLNLSDGERDNYNQIVLNYADRLRKIRFRNRMVGRLTKDTDEEERVSRTEYILVPVFSEDKNEQGDYELLGYRKEYI